MIVDFQADRSLPNFAADVCVVGAGAAGIVLAAELVRQGSRVLLLHCLESKRHRALFLAYAIAHPGQRQRRQRILLSCRNEAWPTIVHVD